MFYILVDSGDSYRIIDNEDMVIDSISKTDFERVKALGIEYKDIASNTELLQRNTGITLTVDYGVVIGVGVSGVCGDYRINISDYAISDRLLSIPDGVSLTYVFDNTVNTDIFNMVFTPHKYFDISNLSDKKAYAFYRNALITGGMSFVGKYVRDNKSIRRGLCLSYLTADGYDKECNYIIPEEHKPRLIKDYEPKVQLVFSYDYVDGLSRDDLQRLVRSMRVCREQLGIAGADKALSMLT